MECLACGRNAPDHESGCPTEAKGRVLEGAYRWTCGEQGCHGSVQVTSEDLLQCRKCARRYSRGEICDTDTPERVLLHRLSPDEEYEHVLALAKRGKKRGVVFKVDLAVKRLRSLEVEWRRQLCQRRLDERRRGVEEAEETSGE